MTRPTDIADRLARADAELPPQPAPAIDFVTLAARRRRHRLAVGVLMTGALLALLPVLSPPQPQQTRAGQVHHGQPHPGSGPSAGAPIGAAPRAHQAAVAAAAALSRRLENLRVAWTSPTGQRAAVTRIRACRTEIRARLATIRAETAIALARPTNQIEPNRTNR
ncbi:MAG: hypothetical protein NXI31_22740 [bacterium]|nr:hypothetical protein [bacterium]